MWLWFNESNAQKPVTAAACRLTWYRPGMSWKSDATLQFSSPGMFLFFIFSKQVPLIFFCLFTLFHIFFVFILFKKYVSVLHFSVQIRVRHSVSLCYA